MGRSIRREAIGVLSGALVITALTGCIAPGFPADEPIPEGLRPTVVALLDTGVNPYHVAFRAPGGSDALAFSASVAGATATALTLSSEGDFADRFERDSAVWEGLEEGELYAFAGTNLLAISFGRASSDRYAIMDGDNHGTGVASTLLLADPNAIIVMVQIGYELCPASGDLDCLIPPSVSAGLSWVAAQPWIDVVSTSIGITGSVPDPEVAHAEAAAYVAASRAAHASGKLIVCSAANDPSASVTDYFAGTPWTIAVTGSDEAQQGKAVYSSTIADLAANYTALTATANSADEWDYAHGTSFSTPIVAGVLSAVIRELRGAVHHSGGITGDGRMAVGSPSDGASISVGSRELRDALNLSAVYFSPERWDPTQHHWFNETDPREKVISYGAGQTIPAAGTFATLGWGHVSPRSIPLVLARILEADFSVPAEKAEAARVMGEYQAAREAYWTNNV